MFKKYICIAVLLAGLVLPLAAQNTEGSNSIFVTNSQIEQIDDSAFGFRIIYRGGDFTQRELYIPTNWIFRDRVVLVSYSRRKSVPYAQFYYNTSDGALRLIRLVLPDNPLDPHWSISSDPDIQQKLASAVFGSLQ